MTVAGTPRALGTTTRAGELVTRVSVAASEFTFVLDKKTAKRGVVVFKVTNVGALKHDRETRLLSGHAAAGLTGAFTVR